MMSWELNLVIYLSDLCVCHISIAEHMWCVMLEGTGQPTVADLFHLRDSGLVRFAYVAVPWIPPFATRGLTILWQIYLC